MCAESAEEAVAAARVAAERFRTIPAPWWRAKAIRLLESLGEAESELVAEAQTIERSLRLAGPAA